MAGVDKVPPEEFAACFNTLIISPSRASFAIWRSFKEPSWHGVPGDRPEGFSRRTPTPGWGAPRPRAAHPCSASGGQEQRGGQGCREARLRGGQAEGSSWQPRGGPGVSAPKAAPAETLQAVRGPASLQARWDPPASSPLITTFCKKSTGDVSSPNCQGVMGSPRSPGLPPALPEHPPGSRALQLPRAPHLAQEEGTHFGEIRGQGPALLEGLNGSPGAFWGPTAPGQSAALLLWLHRAPFNCWGGSSPSVPLGTP